MKYDESLEEIWRIKREIAAEYPSLEAYFQGMRQYQETLKQQGVRFVPLPPQNPNCEKNLVIAESATPYQP